MMRTFVDLLYDLSAAAAFHWEYGLNFYTTKSVKSAILTEFSDEEYNQMSDSTSESLNGRRNQSIKIKDIIPGKI